MAKEFVVGDIVKLKSGGPNMTIQRVSHVYGKKSFHCSWFAGSKLQEGHFDADSLVMAKDEKEKK